MPVDTGLKTFVFFIVLVVGGIVSSIMWAVSRPFGVLFAVATLILAWLLSSAIRMVTQWERAVVLQLGKFAGLRGPGLFFITPLVQNVSRVVDLRTITSTFKAEQSITADTVPVDVDAVLFWKVIDPEKAVLEVQEYSQAVGWAAQTALRDVIGRSTLADILSGRDKIDSVLRSIIDHKTEPWGVQVASVEIRDVTIPAALQDAMSRQAQAERERQARIILGESETQVAAKFMEAAKLYEQSPTALHLRAMNMLYEGMKDKGSMIIVPSSALETMNLGAINLAQMQSNINAGASAPAVAPAVAPPVSTAANPSMGTPTGYLPGQI
ncbi:MAG TPA: slipin family protein [Abditibacterium sp.]|jgi:regulator of protease activity HflC (stomatin/prohibitin superfamily)